MKKSYQGSYESYLHQQYSNHPLLPAEALLGDQNKNYRMSMLDELLKAGITAEFIESHTDTLNRLRLELGMGQIETKATLKEGEKSGDYSYLARVWFDLATQLPYRDDVYGVVIKPQVTQAALHALRENFFLASSRVKEDTCSGYCLALAMVDPSGLKKINPETLDDEIIRAGLAINGAQIGIIDPKKLTQDHVKIALSSKSPLTTMKGIPSHLIDNDLAHHAIDIHGYYIFDLPSKYINAESALMAVTKSPRALFGLDKHLWSDAVIDCALSSDPTIISDIPDTLINQDRVIMVAQKDPMVLHDIDAKWLNQDVFEAVRIAWPNANFASLVYMPESKEGIEPKAKRNHSNENAGMGLG